MLTSVKIAIAEPSAIVRAGLEAQLRKLQHYKAQIIYLMDEQRREWQDVAAVISADIYLINPMLTGANPRAQLPDLAFETRSPRPSTSCCRTSRPLPRPISRHRC